jgi:hypothetical protein
MVQKDNRHCVEAVGEEQQQEGSNEVVQAAWRTLLQMASSQRMLRQSTQHHGTSGQT